LEQDLAVLVPWLERGEGRIEDEEGERCPVVLRRVSCSVTGPSKPPAIRKPGIKVRQGELQDRSVTSRGHRPALTFLTPSLSSHIELPASIPGIRSPIVKGKDTPVELSTEVVMDLR
jgi:hypothetical protein